jgi:hypothetical protein
LIENVSNKRPDEQQISVNFIAFPQFSSKASKHKNIPFKNSPDTQIRQQQVFSIPNNASLTIPTQSTQSTPKIRLFMGHIVRQMLGRKV